ncbi:putative cytosolic oligopeptidase A [Hibiscus syriacus]|uniref:oligopeptidase A n=1 Tax=Hibiscus syriacus TaxID=106335 RepID=A0A6A3AHL8_HIBSY|nr:putative cytosolic oligopeptidase A [Hibiscus syriacus]
MQMSSAFPSLTPAHCSVHPIIIVPVLPPRCCLNPTLLLSGLLPFPSASTRFIAQLLLTSLPLCLLLVLLSPFLQWLLQFPLMIILSPILSCKILTFYLLMLLKPNMLGPASCIVEEAPEPSWPKLVEPLEKIVDQLYVLWGMVKHLKAPEKVKFQLRLGQRKPIYNAFKAIKESSDWQFLSEAHQRIVHAQITEAVLNGVSLEDDEREQFNKIEQKFSENSLGATKKFKKHITDKKEIDGLPATTLGLAAQPAVSQGHENATADNGPWMITLDALSAFSVVQHAYVEDLKSYSKSQGAPEADNLSHWDMNLWSERLRESKYNINEVMDGLFHLAKIFFRIYIEPADGLAPVWNKDVLFYCAKDSSGCPIAYFYFDPYSRPSEKREGSWMNEVVSRSRVLSCNGTTSRLPIAHMVCNQTPPFGDKPSLMTFREVQTVFHEFGHALQHILTKQDEGLVAGLQGIEWDAVDLPSRFLENWCYHRVTFPTTKVYISGTALKLRLRFLFVGESHGEEVYLKLLAAKTFCAGSQSLRQKPGP